MSVVFDHRFCWNCWLKKPGRLCLPYIYILWLIFAENFVVQIEQKYLKSPSDCYTSRTSMFCTHACVIYLKSTINMDRDISIKHATGSCITTFSPKFRVLGTQIQKKTCVFQGQLSLLLWVLHVWLPIWGGASFQGLCCFC